MQKNKKTPVTKRLTAEQQRQFNTALENILSELNQFFNFVTASECLEVTHNLTQFFSENSGEPSDSFTHSTIFTAHLQGRLIVKLQELTQTAQTVNPNLV